MRRSNLSSLAVLSMLTLVSLGCCGPLACGPAGCNGPVGVPAPSCGGCGDCDGCGELYIDPWINEPAACSDPCDSCGNYNGQTCGSCRPVFSGIATLWGYRYDGGCGCGSHRTSCDGGISGYDGGSPTGGCDCGGHGHVMDGGQIMGGGHRTYDQPYAEPLPAPQPTPADDEAEQDEELMESYIPTRDKQIFRRRGTVVQGSPRSLY